MSRDPEAIHHEAQYWSLALDNLTALNDGIARCAEQLGETPLPLLMLGVLERHSTHAETVMAAIQETLRELRAMQPNVSELADLARGRQKVLQREVDELGDNPEEE